MVVYCLFVIGVSSAITGRVGHLLRANDASGAKKSALIGIVFGELELKVICFETVLLAQLLCRLFTTDINFAEELYHNMLFLPIATLGDDIFFGQKLWMRVECHTLSLSLSLSLCLCWDL